MIRNRLSPSFRTFGPNIAWLFGDKLVRLFVSFFVTVYVTRYLGPGRFGLLSFAISFCGLFTTFTNLGLDSIVVRNLVRTPEAKRIILGTTIGLKLLGAIAGVATISSISMLLGYDAATTKAIFVIALGILFLPLNVAELFFQSRIAARFIFLANLASVLVVSTLKIYMVISGADIVGFALVTVAEKFVLGAALIYLYQKENHDLSAWRFRMETAREMLRDSLPLIVSSAFVMIYMRIDQVMIKGMMNNEAVGHYSAAVYVAEGWYFIGIAINSTLFPAIIKAKEQCETMYYNRLQKLCRTMVWLALSVGVTVSLAADKIILLLYGPAYRASADALRINIWTGVFVFLGVASSSWLISENLQRITLYRTAAGAVLNILLNYLTIPRFGISGAAMSTLVSQAVASYLAYAFNRTTSRMFIMQTRAFLPPFAFILRRFSGLERSA